MADVLWSKLNIASDKGLDKVETHYLTVTTKDSLTHSHFDKWKSYPCIWCITQGPVLILRHDAVARILANGSAAFFESCAAIGWKACDSIRLLL